MAETERKLGLKETMSLALGSMVAAGIFLLTGLAINLAGYGIIWAFLLAALITLFSALSYAELATIYPKDGGGYLYVYEAFGNFWGFITGWGTWLSHTVGAAFCIEAFGIYFNTFIYDLGTPLFLALAISAAITAVNITGTGHSTGFELLLNVGKFLLLIIFVSFGFTMGDFSHLIGLKPANFTSILEATALLYVTYFGYSVATNVASEVRDPGKTIPRTIIYSIAIVTVLYLAVAIATLVSGVQVFDENTVGQAAIKLMGSAGGLIIALGVMLGTLSAANANIISANKISCRMAEEGQLSPRLTVTSKRFGTAYRAMLLNFLIIAASLLLGDLGKIVTVSTFIMLLTMILVNLAVLKLRYSHPHLSRDFKVPLYPLTPILGAITSLILMFYMPRESSFLGLCLIAIGMFFYEVRRTPLQKISLLVRENLNRLLGRF